MSTQDFTDTIESLAQIAPHFETTIKRYFEMQVRSRKNRKTKFELETLSLIEENCNILELNNVTLLNFPDFKLSELSFNPRNFCLEANVSSSELVIETNYEASVTGKSVGLRVRLNNVLANGNIGLLYKGDSFIAKNYDLDYKINDISVECSQSTDICLDSKQIEIIKELIKNDSSKWTQTINHLLNLCLGEAVVEVSISECFEVAVNLKAYYSHKISSAIAEVDLFLSTLQPQLTNLEPLATIPYEIKYFMDNENSGVFKLNGGEIMGISSVEHGKDLSLYKNGNEKIIYGNLILNNVKPFSLNFELTTQKLAMNKQIMVKIHQIFIFTKVIISLDENMKQHFKTEIEEIRILKINNPQYEILDLSESPDNLQQLQGKLHYWIKENIRMSIQTKWDEIANLFRED